MSRRVVLLRHGRTEWNAQRRFQGQLDPPLDEVGRHQAYEVASLIAALHPELLVTSDLVRAQETARIVGSAAGVPVSVDAGFRERSLGHWEGLTRDEVEQRYPAEFERWRTGEDVDERGGESRETVAARALAALQALPTTELTVIVTHSATAMALSNALLGIPQAIHPLGPLANCHWTELYTELGDDAPGRWRLRGHNLGTPGTIVPLSVYENAGDSAPDAEA